VPVGIDPREPATGRPAPRRSEFPSSVNLQITGARLLPFKTLRDVAERVDVIRRCIEVRKSQQLALDWDIVLSRQAIKRIMLDDNITSQGKARRSPATGSSRRWRGCASGGRSPTSSTSRTSTRGSALLLEEHSSSTPSRSGRAARQRRRRFVRDPRRLDDQAAPRPPRRDPGATEPGVSADPLRLPSRRVHRVDQRRRQRLPPTSSSTGRATGARGPRTGRPNVEQALAAADIYLKRMNWIRNEFTEGTTPDTFLKLAGHAEDLPDRHPRLRGSDQRRARRQRRRTPPPPHAPARLGTGAMSNFAELYKPELDELLIKLLCACFDVMPTEIGFPPGSGIGGKGHQEGEANSSQRKAVRPTATWIEGSAHRPVTQYLGMPRELEFKLLGYEVEDQEHRREVADSQTRRGGITINDDRAQRGMPLYDFRRPTQPFIVTGPALVFLRRARRADRRRQKAPATG
jgi:hypothetical protein